MSVTGIANSWLPFDHDLVCDGCPYRLNGKCDGQQDATAESFSMNDDSVVGCLNSQRQIEHFSNLQSLSSPSQISHDSELQLPEIIFGINDGFKDFPPFAEDDYFSISFKTLFDEKGFFKYKNSRNLRKALRISESAKLALICTALDPRLEIFWHKTKSTDAWRRIADFQFEFSTSLSFSVYDNNPRFDHIFNRERNFVSHDLLLLSGVNSIPFIFFYNDKDFNEAVSWLKNRPDITKVAIHAQQTIARTAIANMVLAMNALQGAVGRDLYFVVVGVFKILKCVSLKRKFPKLTVVTSSPLYKASCGEKLFSDLSSKTLPKTIPNTDLAVPNINTFREFYSAI